MGTLFLIRHGQASYGSADYDRLSPIGEDQARALGRRVRDAVHGDLHALYTGPLRRQVETGRWLHHGATAAGTTVPDPVVIDELAEYPAFELLAKALPGLIAEESTLAPLRDGERSPLLLDRAFWLMITRWSESRLDAPGVESVVEFAARIRRGLERVMTSHARPSGAAGVAAAPARVAVVTSGGPISIAVALALGLDHARAIALGRQVRNASISEFRWRSRDFAWRPSDFSLVGFNHVAHLPSELHTFR